MVQRQGMLASSCECVACLQKIFGYSKLSACGLGKVLTETSTYSAAEFFDLYTEDELEEAKREGRDYQMNNNE